MLLRRVERIAVPFRQVQRDQQRIVKIQAGNKVRRVRCAQINRSLRHLRFAVSGLSVIDTQIGFVPHRQNIVFDKAQRCSGGGAAVHRLMHIVDDILGVGVLAEHHPVEIVDVPHRHAVADSQEWSD